MTPEPTDAADSGDRDSDSVNQEGYTAQRDHVYKAALASAVLLMAAATAFYHFEEGWSWVDSFYFSSVAATTVGFGDLTPTSDTSKLVTVFYIFAGISLIGVVLNERLNRRARRRVSRSRRHSQ